MVRALKVFQLELHVPGTEDVLCHFKSLSEPLQLLARQNVLEVFSLSIHAHTEQYECDMGAFLTELDKLVCRSAFPNLKTFNMSFVVIAGFIMYYRESTALSAIHEILGGHDFNQWFIMVRQINGLNFHCTTRVTWI